MDAYSEIDCIYFSIGNKTSYAKYIRPLQQEGIMPEIETGTYSGSPPYQSIKRPLPKLLKQYHCAEHKVYNSFMAKIKGLPDAISLDKLALRVPELSEARAASPFSIFCGTTVFISSGILLIASAIPYFLKMNQNPYFMFAWLAFVIVLTTLASYQIQKQFYLAKAEDQHLLLAIEALKEVLTNERNSNSQH